MADTAAVAIEIRDVEKDYRSLRPLRVRALEVREGESLALLGFDQGAAEVFVNLITAATVPDKGDVRVFGRPTVSIEDANTWLTSLDRFGIVSERAIVIDHLTVADNLAMPLTLALHEVDRVIHEKVEAIAVEVGLPREDLERQVATLGPAARLRLRLGRALAPDPRIVLSEHPNALVEPADAGAYAATYARIVANRGITSVVLTADSAFASAVASRILTLHPATGELKPMRRWSRLFR